MDLDDIWYEVRQEAIERPDNFPKIGRLLLILQDHGELDVPGFVRVTGIERRTCYHFLQIAKTVEHLHIPDEQQLSIGWTKMSIICPELDASNMTALLEAAEKLTVRELKAFVAGEPVPGPARCVLLYFRPKEFVVFETVLSKHGYDTLHPSPEARVAALMKALTNDSTSGRGRLR
ncbi:hypothetical protein [Labrys sp. (in: a-proteobacteria)]|uniref:hypothetical protein n=1 Tax=Labrys sp. (in: a-proteobacteria) TaxID=1917972 RepID=UPI0039E693C0